MSRACPEEAARPAATEDLDELTALREEARQTVAPNRGGAALIGRDHPRSDVDDVLRAGLEGQGGVAVLVGTLDDMVVGYLIADNATEDGSQRVAMVHEFWVTPGARGLGVGEQLVTEVMDWARRMDCVAIDADVLPGDRETKNFFETHGLVARGIRVSRRLD